MLVVDDDPETLALIRDVLADENVQLFEAPTAESALEQFSNIRPRIVLSDLMLPGMSGLDFLDRVMATDPGIDFILMTGHYSTDSAVEAIRRGGSDYLPKPLNVARLRSSVHTLVEDALTRRKTFRLAKIRRIAPHFQSVLITGETGTGKELVAQALHNLSPVASAPFAVCNCSALVETLLESELFGHVRGAFTGAVQNKEGIFEFAGGGVVFLDEIGELPLTAQAKLLRVLQNRQVQRVGSPVLHQVNVRVIAATHRDLRKMVASGQFREDLFYRLSAVEIQIPNLAQRKEDLPLLQRHFVEKYAARYTKEITGITRRAQTRLAAHSWHGNVRELENVISGSCIMAVGNVIDLADLPESFRVPAPVEDITTGELVTMETMEQRYLMKVLKTVDGNKAKAAEILGIGRNTIYQMLSRMGVAEKHEAEDKSA